ncbi:MAG: aminotransferase class I/II-fold pyridoxal phosphate-dependent enzyme, partial [Candidatus Zixiibacteriota bacterium]
HPKVIEAAVGAMKEYGTGSCSSRILAGTTSLHTKLESKLAKFKGVEDALVFSTGFMTMAGTVSGIMGKGDVILSDEFNHASIVDGCRLSGADVRIYKHNDMGSLEEHLAGRPASANKLIVTDGVFSMRGTVANLPRIVDLAQKHNAVLMVDDAHGTGVLGKTGRGTPEHFGLDGRIDIVCGTFSKSLGTIGGFAGSSKEIISYLRLNSRPFLFTAAPPPSVVATVIACLEVIEEEPELLVKLHDNTRIVKEGLSDAGFSLEDTVTPIIPVLIGDDRITFKVAAALEDEGIMVNPVVAPAVPPGNSLIRISVMASFSTDQLVEAIRKIKLVGQRMGIV